MAKQYNQEDFDRVVFNSEERPQRLPHANDETPRVQPYVEPPSQRAGYAEDIDKKPAANQHERPITVGKIDHRSHEEKEIAETERKSTVMNAIEGALAHKKNHGRPRQEVVAEVLEELRQPKRKKTVASTIAGILSAMQRDSSPSNSQSQDQSRGR